MLEIAQSKLFDIIHRCSPIQNRSVLGSSLHARFSSITERFYQWFFHNSINFWQQTDDLNRPESFIRGFHEVLIKNHYNFLETLIKKHSKQHNFQLKPFLSFKSIVEKKIRYCKYVARQTHFHIWIKLKAFFCHFCLSHFLEK